MNQYAVTITVEYMDGETEDLLDVFFAESEEGAEDAAFERWMDYINEESALILAVHTRPV